ncbi:hypothetical protein EDC52_102284 [Biostraticola tofi]|uniref:Uncharacterized protein n=1 Tax=Biostraticola tofi TaxID=466109 RepID=A0A4R3Z1S8_9GAMM|nr:hypothetical protein EDC52_102284 [Biostraticola tofi]
MGASLVHWVSDGAGSGGIFVIAKRLKGEEMPYGIGVAHWGAREPTVRIMGANLGALCRYWRGGDVKRPVRQGVFLSDHYFYHHMLLIDFQSL